MKIYGDYHTHTKQSDGKGSVLDNILSAQKNGLSEIAIADHSFATIACKMTRTKFDLQEKLIAEYCESYEDRISVLHSVEGNLLGFDGEIDIPEDIIQRVDILHVGFHRFLNFEKAFANAKYTFVNGYGSARAKEKMRELNTTAYLRAMDKYPIDVLVHLGHRCPVDMKAICQKAVEKDVYIELNEKHVETLERDVESLIENGVKLIVGSDAHKPERVGKFERVIAFIEKHNIPLENVYGIGQRPVFKTKK